VSKTPSQAAGNKARSATDASTVAQTKETVRTDPPKATSARPEHSRSARTSASRGKTAKSDYVYSADDGVPNSGTQAPDVAQAEPAAQDVPAAKKSGILALTGTDTTALIFGSVGLILVGTLITALTRRRRSTGAYR
jgi:hypothetical protein